MASDSPGLTESINKSLPLLPVVLAVAQESSETEVFIFYLHLAFSTEAYNLTLQGHCIQLWALIWIGGELSE